MKYSTYRITIFLLSFFVGLFLFLVFTAESTVTVVNPPAPEKIQEEKGNMVAAFVTHYSSIDSCHYPVKEGCLMASGKVAYIGAVACPSYLPFNTVVKIKGRAYVCEDRYAQRLDSIRGGQTFDIFEGYGNGAHQKAITLGIELLPVEVFE